NEPCEFGGTTHTANSSNPDCTNPKNSQDTNDWGVNSGGTFHQYRTGGGGGGYEYDNCTDFVDWIVDSNGEVAVSTSHNHVAYITAVNGGNITVEEYNQDEMGNGDIQTGTPASMWFD